MKTPHFVALVLAGLTLSSPANAQSLAEAGEAISGQLTELDAQLNDPAYIKRISTRNLSINVPAALNELRADVASYEATFGGRKKAKTVLGGFQTQLEALDEQYTMLLGRKTEADALIGEINAMKYKWRGPDQCVSGASSVRTLIDIAETSSGLAARRAEGDDVLPNEKRVRAADARLAEFEQIRESRPAIVACLSQSVDGQIDQLDRDYPMEHAPHPKQMMGWIDELVLGAEVYTAQGATLDENQRERVAFYGPKSAELDEYISSGAFANYVIDQERMVWQGETNHPLSSTLSARIVERLRPKVGGSIERVVSVAKPSGVDSRGRVELKVRVAVGSSKDGTKRYIVEEFFVKYMADSLQVVDDERNGPGREIRKENIGR